jgi:DNA-binding response OmpR family regulator
MVESLRSLSGSQEAVQTSRNVRPRIFIAEDDEDVVQGLQWMLSKRFEVSPQASALAFVRRCAVEMPDLMLIDYQLPDFNGIDLLRIVRAATGTSLPAILMSAHGERSAEALENGFDSFVAKPLQEAELLAAIDRALGISAVLPSEGGSRATKSATSRGARSCLRVLGHPEPTQTAPDSISPTREGHAAPRRRVLVVEDDEDLRAALSELLGSRYDLELLESVQDGIEGFAIQRPDVLILDYELPDGTGVRLLEAIRKYWGSQPPAVIVSAHGDRRALCLEAGCTIFLEKPFQTGELVLAIERALAQPFSD